MHLLIADDHELFRSGFMLLVSQLFSDASIVAVGDGDAAWDALDQGTPFDLVFLDLLMPRMNGLWGVRRFLARQPAVPLVVLSACEDVKTIVECARLGALGYIPKTANEQVLKSAVALLLQGEIFFPRAAVPGILADGAGRRSREVEPSKNPFRQLTQYQLETLALIVEGKTNREIAQSLDIPESEVKAHTKVIMRKLSVRNRTQAALVATELGYERFLQRPSWQRGYAKTGS